VVFTPDANFTGEATFTYKVTDGSLKSGLTTVKVNISDPNDNDAFPAGSPPGSTTGTVDAFGNVFGTGGVDTIDMSKDNGGQTIYSGSGDDTVTAGQGTDKVYGGSGNDTIKGSDQRDELYGGSGNDKISGDGQNDTIVGGLGADQLTGGSGDDTFRFTNVLDSRPGSANTYDTVTDFTRNNPGTNGDLLDFSLIDGLNGTATLLTGTTLAAHSVGWVVNADKSIDVYANTSNSTQTVGAAGTADMQVHLNSVVGKFDANAFLI
jgi:Ca2+-binding RTX toxin-like protein